MFSDGHTHSTFSDGNMPPDEIIDLAYKIMRKLGETEGILSICDHNNVAAVNETLYHSQQMFRAGDIELYYLPGAEVDAKGGTHLLLYFFPEGKAWKKRDILDIFHKNDTAREERNRATIDRLEEVLEIDLDYDELYGCGAGGVRTRLPIVQALVTGGYAPNIDIARNTFVGYGCPAHIPFEAPFEGEEIVSIASENGVFPAIAHPFRQSDEGLYSLLSSGLKGIEIVNGKSRFNQEYNFARENKILPLIGSDCHFNGSKRFGYSVVHNHGGKQLPTHYNMSADFLLPIEKGLREAFLEPLKNP